MKKNNKQIPILILFLVSLFVVGLGVVWYLAAVDLKENRDKQIEANLEYIYSNANTVIQIEGSLTGPGNDGELNKSLTDLTKITVYNDKQKNKYSVSKENGKVKVFYGEGKSAIKYPKDRMSDTSINKEDLKNEDLFSYYTQNGQVTITGFSESGLKFIESKDTVKIPSAYKGKPVTNIADSAFYNKRIMGQVIIPESIRVIGNNSFSMNGAKRDSNNISKPYAGTWILEGKKWVKVK